MEQIYLDSTDWEGMFKLMDEHGDSKTMFPGTSENGEMVIISIFKDKIVTDTYQKNGWIRKNIYHRDFTVEELYEHGEPAER